MPRIDLLVGDCRDALAALPGRSAHCCVTSPPFFRLRDYGEAGQIGLEATPEEYVANLVGVFRAVRRVLRDDATLWLNLGDCYDKRTRTLLMIPSRVALALQADGWLLRSNIVWLKPNPMPEPVRNRPTCAHESVFLFSKAAKYYYDHESVKEKAVSDHASGNGFRRDARLSYKDERGVRGSDREWSGVGGLRNLRNVWNVPVKPFKAAHFAVFPERLVEPCVKAGSPVGGTVLDPFGGSGTTAVVAHRLGRDAVLCELNAGYAGIAADRFGGCGIPASDITVRRDADKVVDAAREQG